MGIFSVYAVIIASSRLAYFLREDFPEIVLCVAVVDFHGQKRTNTTHASKTDPGAKLSHMGHTLTDNRNGLIVGVAATEASGTVERTAEFKMVDELKAKHGLKPKTLGADKGCEQAELSWRDSQVQELRSSISLKNQKQYQLGE